MRIRRRYRKLEVSRVVSMILARIDKEQGRPYEHHIADARNANHQMIRIRPYCNVRKKTLNERRADIAWRRMADRMTNRVEG